MLLELKFFAIFMGGMHLRTSYSYIYEYACSDKLVHVEVYIVRFFSLYTHIRTQIQTCAKRDPIVYFGDRSKMVTPIKYAPVQLK